ncbi:hypothetical protein [Tahibacter harae]|uniref:DUF3426 domain-containing protein n=1 Tax=Tahibacter harae TaxID=2963937 RepID=A0ABT1QYP5_9GAMM|nr:hypothetical protein [Tahibacter harae]MCQ4167415.1 hypothetical protein [Tahibacter harae]
MRLLKRRLSQPGWLDGNAKQVSVWLLLGAVGAVAGLATWLSGGFAAAKPPALPALEAGKGLDTGQWHVVVQRAWLSARRADGREAPPGKVALNLDVELTNRTRESSSDIASAFRIGLPAITPKTPPTLLRDNSVLGMLHPKMPERVALSWEVPAGTAIPDPLPVVILSKVYKSRDNLSGGAGWFTPKPLAEVHLHVAAPDAPVTPP